MPCLWRDHDRRVMGGRRLLPDPLSRLAADAGLKVEHLGYWNSWLNRALVMLLRLEERCAWILPLPWGISLILSARKPDIAGPRQSEQMAAEGSRGA